MDAFSTSELWWIAGLGTCSVLLLLRIGGLASFRRERAARRGIAASRVSTLVFCDQGALGDLARRIARGATLDDLVPHSREEERREDTAAGLSSSTGRMRATLSRRRARRLLTTYRSSPDPARRLEAVLEELVGRYVVDESLVATSRDLGFAVAAAVDEHRRDLRVQGGSLASPLPSDLAIGWARREVARRASAHSVMVHVSARWSVAETDTSLLLTGEVGTSALGESMIVTASVPRDRLTEFGGAHLVPGESVALHVLGVARAEIEGALAVTPIAAYVAAALHLRPAPDVELLPAAAVRALGRSLTRRVPRRRSTWRPARSQRVDFELRGIEVRRDHVRDP